MDPKEILSVIEKSAPAVAEQSAALESAIAAERAAETAVLEAAVAAVRPALRVLSSRITQSSYETLGRNGCNPVSRTTSFDERGLCLIQRFDSTKDESGNRGALGGDRLYLLDDGRFAVVERQGTFSNWQSEPNEWEATIAFQTAAEAMADYDLDDCLTAIRDALEKHLAGNMVKRTAAALERAERLKAIATLATK